MKKLKFYECVFAACIAAALMFSCSKAEQFMEEKTDDSNTPSLTLH